MIGSPDLLAFTTEPDFIATPPEVVELPEELSVPLYSASGDTSPWSKISSAGFQRDFILVAEFSEQVGPQPLLTIPDKTKACEMFDLNRFALRIMSVDYQTAFASPSGCGFPKLNFVEDSRVVLGDSEQGAYAYVHHLTLYDLEARGFVRPFCMAYVSSEEDKLVLGFRELSAEFSKAAECLKTGNRKSFANELDKKLADMEYTRLVLLRELKRDGLISFGVSERNGGGESLNNEVACEGDNENVKTNCETTKEEKGRGNGRSGFVDDLKCGQDFEGEKSQQTCEEPEQERQILWPNKTAELAGLVKAIQEHKNLLKQVTSFPNRKLGDPEFLPYDPEDGPHALESDLDLNFENPHIRGSALECSASVQHSCSHPPQLVRASLCRRFDQPLKNLEQLCDEYFLEQSLKQLRSIEKNFRGDKSNLLAHQLAQNLLPRLKSTNFLFEHLESEIGQQLAWPQIRPATALPSKNGPGRCLELYRSCVEMVPIKLDVRRIGLSMNMSSTRDDLPLTPDSPTECDSDPEEAFSEPRKGSVSSGESIEVLGIEKYFKTLGSHYTAESAPRRPACPPAIVESRKQRVVTRRENSEDSIEVLSTTDSIIPDDLRASYPAAIYEVTPEHEGQEDAWNPSQEEKALEECLCTVGDSVQVECQVKCQDYQMPTVIVNPTNRTIIPDVNLDSPTFGAFSPVGRSPLLQDDLSDCTSSYSFSSIVSEQVLSNGVHREWNHCMSRRKRGKLGRAALQFLHRFPFALHAVYSLLSGRTLVVVGSEETVVRRCVMGLTIYTPQLGGYRESIQPWTSGPLQITDLLTWKLIGLNRTASTSSLGMPLYLSRYSRYLSVLDVDQKTLRCPAYRGSLICPLVAPRARVMRGTLYFLYAQSLIGKLVSRAFLFTFVRGLHHPGSPMPSERVEHFRSQFHPHDLEMLSFLSELVTQHVMGTPPTSLRFSYDACTVFKL